MENKLIKGEEMDLSEYINKGLWAEERPYLKGNLTLSRYDQIVFDDAKRTTKFLKDRLIDILGDILGCPLSVKIEKDVNVRK